MPNQKQPTAEIDVQHARLLARHLQDEISNVSATITAQGSRLRTSEIYFGLAKVILKTFIDHEGFSTEKMQAFGDNLKETLRDGLARANAERTLRK